MRCSEASVQRWVILSDQGRGVVRKVRAGKRRLLDDSATKRAVQQLKREVAGGTRFASAQAFTEGHVLRAPFRQTVVLADKHAARNACGFLKFSPSLPKKGFTEVTRKKREAHCRTSANRDWSMVMFTDGCKFLYRFPGSHLRQGRWANQCTKRSERGFIPSHPPCYNVHGESLYTARESSFQWPTKTLRPPVTTITGEAGEEGYR